MVEAPDRLWIWFADREMAQPLHIRQWQSTPFAEGTEYVSTPIAAWGAEATVLIPEKLANNLYRFLNDISVAAISIRGMHGDLTGNAHLYAVALKEAFDMSAALSTAGAAEPVAWRWRHESQTDWEAWTFIKVRPTWLEGVGFVVEPLFDGPQASAEEIAEYLWETTLDALDDDASPPSDTEENRS